MKICLFVWLLSSACLPAVTPDAKQLIVESIEAEGVNNRASANWLGREDIRHYSVSGGKKKRTGWQTFEASFLEGRPYYRKIANDGKPLTPKQSAAEDARMEAESKYRKNIPRKDQVSNDRRIAFGLKSTLESHDFRIVREEVIRGRRTWVVEGALRPDAPAPATPLEGGLSSDFEAWIDQESKLAVREELRVRRDWMHLRPGSTVTVEFEFNGGLRLVSNVVLRSAPDEKGRFTDTEQTYSSYKKFEAESQLILVEKP
jgi:hypothetical protein